MSRRRIGWALVAAVVALAFAGSVVAARLLVGPEASAEQGSGARRSRAAARIVSLAPSVTEVAFAVGCGDRLVGATRFCNHPEAAKRIPRIGGYANPSLEAVLRQRPDLVVGTAGTDHHAFQEALGRVGVATLVVDHSRIEGVLSSFRQIGRACGAEARGEAWVTRLRGELAAVAARTKDRPRRSVLIVFGRSGVAGGLREVYVAGRGGLYDEVIRLAGGQNAFRKPVPAFPKLSVEGILQVNPDVIVELAPEAIAAGHSVAALEASWRALPGLVAVRAGRVRLIAGDYGEVPGPRLFRLVEEVARTVHPEAAWGRP